MRVLVVNARSGLARRLASRSGRVGREEVARALRGMLREAGVAGIEVVVAGRSELLPSLRRAVAEADEVWVGGGDGTIRTAAGLLVKGDKPLGVLPLGTMNLLARDLGVPLEPVAALHALDQAPVARIDVGRMNGELFLNKSALGLYPEMIIDRERRRRLWGYGKWPAMFRAMWRALRRNRLMELTLEVDGERRRIVTPALVVATNAYEFRVGRLFRKPELASGTLTAYVSHETWWGGTAGQFVKLFLGRLEGDPELEVLQVPSLTLHFHGSRPVANDGEVEFVRGPVEYVVDPLALAVRWPALGEAIED